jgi:seryl-tRNA(Sec) selenium transferase
MVELRLNRELYAPAAIEAVAEIYRAYAEIELGDEAGYRLVRVRAASPEREHRVAGELGNHALGLTIRRRGSEP